MTVTKFEYDGNQRRGLTAAIRLPDGSNCVVSAADIVLADAFTHRFIAAYRQWIGVATSSAGSPRPRKSRPAVTAASKDNIDVAVLSLSERLAHCKILDRGETVILRSRGPLDIVPGEIATINLASRWIYGGVTHLSGDVEATRFDVNALRLTPLRLEPRGIWDPAGESWGDPGEPIEAWARKIIRYGRRPMFEMEQVVPGYDPNELDSDPIIRSNDQMDAGDFSGAYDILMSLCRADLRCLDAHAHLGNLAFDNRLNLALRHYEAGTRIGELSLPANINFVLPWAMIDNRPFLRCLHGLGLCLWRLKRFQESAAVFDRLLWLNPSDNQGVRLLIAAVGKRWPWRPDV